MRHTVPVALVFVGLIACGGGGSKTSSPTTPTVVTPPTSTNHAPVITSAAVSPTFGIDSLTLYTFSAQATDQDGDTLTYQWQIGTWTYRGQRTKRVCGRGKRNGHRDGN